MDDLSWGTTRQVAATSNTPKDTTGEKGAGVIHRKLKTNRPSSKSPTTTTPPQKNGSTSNREVEKPIEHIGKNGILPKVQDQNGLNEVLARDIDSNTQAVSHK